MVKMRYNTVPDTTSYPAATDGLQMPPEAMLELARDAVEIRR